MIAQMLKRRIGPESLKAQLVQGSIILTAAIFLVAGFRSIAELDLTEAPMLLGFGEFTNSVGHHHPNPRYYSFERSAQVASIPVRGPVQAAVSNALASFIYPW